MTKILNSNDLDTIKVSLETSIIKGIETHIKLFKNPEYDGYPLFYAKDCFNTLNKIVEKVTDIKMKVLNLSILFDLVEDETLKQEIEKALYEERADEMPF